MYYRYTLILLITLSMACSGSGTEGEGDNTGLTAQEELCADYPENIQCPTLPAPPTLEDGTDFSDWTPKMCPSGYMPEFGKDNCISIGDPCPEGDWPENLPTSNVKYVTPGGTGDGSSPQNAAGSIQQMLNGASSGATIALSKGIFDEAIRVSRAQDVIGACSRDTVLRGPAPDLEFDATVWLEQQGNSTIKNLTITGPRIGLVAIDSSNPFLISGVRIDGAQDYGVMLSVADVTLENMVIQNTRSDTDGSLGRGLNIDGTSWVTLNNLFLDANREASIAIFEPGTRVVASDIVVQNTQTSNGDLGNGISVEAQSRLVLERGYLDGNGALGLAVYDADSRVEASDLVVRNTLGDSAGSGRGIHIQNGARLILTRAELESNRGAGIYIGYSGTQAELTDVRVESTLPTVRGIYGRGLSLENGASLTFERLQFESNTEVGFTVVDAGTNAEGTDLIVRNTNSRVDGSGGSGVQVNFGASLVLERGFLDGNRESSLLVSDVDSSLSASDLVIQNTQVASCAEDPELECGLAGGGFGDGLLVIGGSSVELNRFSATGHERVAMYFYDVTGIEDESLGGVTGAPSLSAENGEVTSNLYGINIRGDSVTPQDLVMVACYENEKTVDGCYSEQELTVPSPGSVLGN